MTTSRDLSLWNEIVRLERSYTSNAFPMLPEIEDLPKTLSIGLNKPEHRGTALRLLLLMGEELKQALFGQLIEIASVGHSDIELCRSVIKSMPRAWVLKTIESFTKPILAKGGEEEFRRFAELLGELDDDLLAKHAEAGLDHDDPEVREVAQEILANMK